MPDGETSSHPHLNRWLTTSAAAIRYELSDHYTYEFVEGATPWERSNQDAALSEEPTFTYCHPEQADSCLRTIHDLDQFFEDEGPFDGIIGFGLGASLAILWLKNKQEALDMGDITNLPVKVVIMFSTSYVHDYRVLAKGNTVGLDPSPAGARLDLPSAHIWGAEDPFISLAQAGAEFFNHDRLSTHIHDRGHGIPSAMEDVVQVAKAINQAIVAISLA
ncbi:Serine hydrolase FSH1 [Aspergillus parasiticus SU-1]|uniref:Serine hydrolase FSH1 n=1 Tax=Aspergillus parasiticus (strain ATCC 56775 / NRRL 5862 / SRRC 143 / SU-1) TaxID=1403190 RepID=A0A0F0I7Y1_ASPPU|nr:Serine hydrolase FSH1 [Aspergillus parasiticus SU-1]